MVNQIRLGAYLVRSSTQSWQLDLHLNHIQDIPKVAHCTYNIYVPSLSSSSQHYSFCLKKMHNHRAMIDKQICMGIQTFICATLAKTKLGQTHTIFNNHGGSDFFYFYFLSGGILWAIGNQESSQSLTYSMIQKICCTKVWLPLRVGCKWTNA